MLKVHPSIVIGLGEFGLKVIHRFKQYIRREYEEIPCIESACLDFSCVDVETSESHLKLYEQFDSDELYVLKLPQRSSIVDGQGRLLPSVILKEQGIAQADWLPQSVREARFDYDDDMKFRALSRIGFFTEYAKIATFLKEKLNRITLRSDIAPLRERGIDVQFGLVDVYILCSLAETYSTGVLIDLAYQIRNLFQSDFYGQDCRITAFLAMPEKLQGNDNTESKAVAYAALKEFDFLMSDSSIYVNGDGQEVRYECSPPESPGFSTKKHPFDFCYLFDSVNEKGFSLETDEEFFSFFSSALDIFILSPVGERIVLAANNLNPKQSYNGKVTTYSSFALLSLSYPQKALREYLASIIGNMLISSVLLKPVDDSEAKNAARDILNRQKLSFEHIKAKLLLQEDYLKIIELKSDDFIDAKEQWLIESIEDDFKRKKEQLLSFPLLIEQNLGKLTQPNGEKAVLEDFQEEIDELLESEEPLPFKFEQLQQFQLQIEKQKGCLEQESEQKNKRVKEQESQLVVAKQELERQIEHYRVPPFGAFISKTTARTVGWFLGPPVWLASIIAIVSLVLKTPLDLPAWVEPLSLLGFFSLSSFLAWTIKRAFGDCKSPFVEQHIKETRATSIGIASSVMLVMLFIAADYLLLHFYTALPSEEKLTIGCVIGFLVLVYLCLAIYYYWNFKQRYRFALSDYIHRINLYFTESVSSFVYQPAMEFYDELNEKVKNCIVKLTTLKEKILEARNLLEKVETGEKEKLSMTESMLDQSILAFAQKREQIQEKIAEVMEKIFASEESGEIGEAVNLIFPLHPYKNWFAKTPYQIAKSMMDYTKSRLEHYLEIPDAQAILEEGIKGSVAFDEDGKFTLLKIFETLFLSVFPFLPVSFCHLPDDISISDLTIFSLQRPTQLSILNEILRLGWVTLKNPKKDKIIMTKVKFFFPLSALSQLPNLRESYEYLKSEKLMDIDRRWAEAPEPYELTKT